jgi:hypothetical protein
MADKVKAVHAQAAAGNVDLHYDPQATEMVHDSAFSDFAPGVVSSGNLAHKWNVEGDHSNGEEPSTGLKGD